MPMTERAPVNPLSLAVVSQGGSGQEGSEAGDVATQPALRESAANLDAYVSPLYLQYQGPAQPQAARGGFGPAPPTTLHMNETSAPWQGEDAPAKTVEESSCCCCRCLCCRAYGPDGSVTGSGCSCGFGW